MFVMNDQHNVVFAYGPIDIFVNNLNRLEYKEMEFEYPAPHCHSFHEENDEFEKSIIKDYNWKMFPLKPNDTYDD